MYCQSNIVSFLDPPWKAERGSGVRSDSPVTWGRAILHKECHNWIFKCGTWASVHMDHYTASFTNAQDDHKVYWDSWKTAYETRFPIQFIIWSLTSCTPRSNSKATQVAKKKMSSTPWAATSTYQHWNDVRAIGHFMITATVNYGMYTYTS